MTQTERNARIMEAIRSATRRWTASPEIARETLIKEGIYTPAGRLTVEYGGAESALRKAGGGSGRK